ncbi:MAG: ubiquitin-like domain-containing protein [Actinomycetes bacterium]
MRPSPARIEAPEPEAWLPICDVTAAVTAAAPVDARGFTSAGQERAAARDRLDAELRTLAPAGASPSRPLAPRPEPVAAVAVHRSRLRHALEAAGAVVVIAGLALGLSRLIGSPHPNRYVPISVDGTTATVQTNGARVADLLVDAGVVLRRADRVVPDPATPLRDGLEVRVLRAFPVTVDLDGAARTVRTTRAVPARLLRELDAAPGAVVVDAPRRLRRGARVVVRTPRTLTLAVDGATRPLVSTGLTVREALMLAGVTVGPNDEVDPGLDVATVDGQRVRVTRLASGQRTALVRVPFTTERRAEPNLDQGQTRILRAGVDGQQRIVYGVALRDGVESGRWVVRTEAVRAPVSRIIAVGTRPVRRATATRPATPTASSTGRSETGQGSFYAFTAASCAHKTLPFGTVVRIVNLSTGASTTCTIRDRGPFGPGRIIDMSKDTFGRIAPLSQGVVPVRIEW